MKKSIAIGALALTLSCSAGLADIKIMYDMNGKPALMYNAPISNNSMADVLKGMSQEASDRHKQSLLDRQRQMQEIELLQLQIEQLRRNQR
jgi:hypothetical protein